MAAAAKDASNGTSREIGRYIQGSRTQEIPFKGPAFRSLPANNTVVSLLEKENQDNKPAAVELSGKPPNLFVETWAGSAGLTREAVLQGFVGKAYEKHPYKPDGDAEPMAEGDVMRKENISEIAQGIKGKKYYHFHASPSCVTWGTLQNLNGTTRDRDRPA